MTETDLLLPGSSWSFVGLKGRAPRSRKCARGMHLMRTGLTSVGTQMIQELRPWPIGTVRRSHLTSANSAETSSFDRKPCSSATRSKGPYNRTSFTEVQRERHPAVPILGSSARPSSDAKWLLDESTSAVTSKRAKAAHLSTKLIPTSSWVVCDNSNEISWFQQSALRS